MYPWLKADQVADILIKLLVKGDKKIYGDLRRSVDLGQIAGKRRAGRFLHQKGGKFNSFFWAVIEGDLIGVGFEKEIEGVKHRHLSDQIYFDAQAIGFLRKHQPRQIV